VRSLALVSVDEGHCSTLISTSFWNRRSRREPIFFGGNPIAKILETGFGFGLVVCRGFSGVE